MHQKRAPDPERPFRFGRNERGHNQEKGPGRHRQGPVGQADNRKARHEPDVGAALAVFGLQSPDHQATLMPIKPLLCGWAYTLKEYVDCAYKETKAMQRLHKSFIRLLAVVLILAVYAVSSIGMSVVSSTGANAQRARARGRARRRTRGRARRRGQRRRRGWGRRGRRYRRGNRWYYWAPWVGGYLYFNSYDACYRACRGNGNSKGYCQDLCAR
jgi:hypothetical protein